MHAQTRMKLRSAVSVICTQRNGTGYTGNSWGQLACNAHGAAAKSPPNADLRAAGPIGSGISRLGHDLGFNSANAQAETSLSTSNRSVELGTISLRTSRGGTLVRTEQRPRSQPSRAQAEQAVHTMVHTT